MRKRHLIRSICEPSPITACGIDPNYKKITLSPRDVTCQSCLRCMTKNEVLSYLGKMADGITIPNRLLDKSS
jgi:hypothetical protein